MMGSRPSLDGLPDISTFRGPTSCLKIVLEEIFEIFGPTLVKVNGREKPMQAMQLAITISIVGW